MKFNADLLFLVCCLIGASIKIPKYIVDFWPRLWLLFSLFSSILTKRKKKRRMNIKIRDKNSCLSGRSETLGIFQGVSWNQLNTLLLEPISFLWYSRCEVWLYIPIQSAKILLVPPKFKMIMVLYNYLLFQYCDSKT